MKPLKDRFSEQSESYKKFRPIYPLELYNYILRYCSGFQNAWDCGTGNGQVAIELAKYFENVAATDISKSQLSKASVKANIHYAKQRAEETNFSSNSFDLITVAQALHWFDHPAFFKEVKRVLKPNGILAVWGYDLLKVSAEIDGDIVDFYSNVVGPYWDTERKHIETNYSSINFPFSEVISNNQFFIEAVWSIDHLEGYFNSWSAVQNFRKQNKGLSPVNKLVKEIKYKMSTTTFKVKFPIFLKICRF